MEIVSLGIERLTHIKITVDLGLFAIVLYLIFWATTCLLTVPSRDPVFISGIDKTCLSSICKCLGGYSSG